MHRRALFPVLLVLAGVGIATGCSPPPPQRPPPQRPPGMSGGLTVFAASSLTEALNDEQATLRSSAPALHLTYNFAGSQSLVTQLTQGAPADVIATADMATMQGLVARGLVETPQVMARNRLEIVVAGGNPTHVSGLADLARPGLKLVLADLSVPAGRYAQQALDRAGIKVSPVSRELDVKAAVAKVTLGEADAAIVYVTDITGTGVPIPEAQNVIASYPVAVIKASAHHAAAQAYVDELLHGTGQRALQARGFLAAG